MNLLEKCNPNLKGHSSIVLCTIPIDNKRIATGSLDKTIRIWNDSQSIKLLTGHNGAVNQLILHSATLMISCSDDKELRLWDLKAYVCIKRFLGHTAPVTSLCSVSPDLCHKYFSEPKQKIIRQYGLVVSSGCDSIIRIWVMDGYTKNTNSIYSLEAHTTSVTCLALIESHNSSFINNHDSLIDLQQFSQQFSQQNHSPLKEQPIPQLQQQQQQQFQTQSLQLFLISGGTCAEILIWHLPSQQLVRKLEGISANISCILFNQYLNKIIVSCFDRQLSIYINQQHSSQKEKEKENNNNGLRNTDFVNSMCVFQESYMIFSTNYNKIEIWDYKTVKCIQKIKITDNTIFGLSYIGADKFAVNIGNQTCLFRIVNRFYLLLAVMKEQLGTDMIKTSIYQQVFKALFGQQNDIQQSIKQSNDKQSCQIQVQKVEQQYKCDQQNNNEDILKQIILQDFDEF